MTMGIKLGLLLAAALPLVACSKETAVSSETPIPVEPDGGIGDGAPPLPDSGDETTGVAQIPERFRGVWDADGGTCDPYSDMRLEIEADQVLFYESGGQVRSLQIEGDSMRLDLAMSGEGETWRSLLQFTLRDDGTLHVVDAATPNAEDPIPRKRCS